MEKDVSARLVKNPIMHGQQPMFYRQRLLERNGSADMYMEYLHVVLTDDIRCNSRVVGMEEDACAILLRQSY